MPRRAKHIIDDAGRVWKASDRLFRASLGGSDLSDTELLGFVTRNLGFIQLNASAMAVRIVLREDIVGVAARASLVYYLLDHPHVDHIRVCNLSSEPVPEAVMSSQGFLAWLRRMDIDRELKAQSRFHLLPRGAGVSPRIGDFLGVWRQKRLRSAADIRDYCSTHFGGRFLFARRQGVDDLRIAEIGAGYKSYDLTYLNQAKGTRLAEDPDYLYGLWIERHYHEADTTQTPHVSRVKAEIMPPYRTPVSVTYDRIILPFADLDGAPYLVSASVLVPGA